MTYPHQPWPNNRPYKGHIPGSTSGHASGPTPGSTSPQYQSPTNQTPPQSAPAPSLRPYGVTTRQAASSEPSSNPEHAGTTTLQQPPQPVSQLSPQPQQPSQLSPQQPQQPQQSQPQVVYVPVATEASPLYAYPDAKNYPKNYLSLVALVLGVLSVPSTLMGYSFLVIVPAGIITSIAALAIAGRYIPPNRMRSIAAVGLVLSSLTAVLLMTVVFAFFWITAGKYDVSPNTCRGTSCEKFEQVQLPS